MDRLKRLRTAQRTAFTKNFTAITAELDKQTPNLTVARAILAVLSEKNQELNDLNKQIFEAMVDKEDADDDVNKELEGCDDYKTRFEMAKTEVALLMDRLAAPNVIISARDENVSRSNLATAENSRKFKLPKIELPRFNGDPKEWLQFWGIFQKIHEDAQISNEEKFHYLSQAVVENTRASEIVRSYPPTAENYKKAVESLKNRFGRSDLLIEVYVREMLKLVLNKSKTSLTATYDKLETHLRALESLGVGTEKCAAMLFPLVESSLPEEILRTWQRQNNNATDAKERLEELMKFLGNEVQNEERISMVKSGFELTPDNAATVGKDGKKKKVNSDTGHGVASAAALLGASEEKQSSCIFCGEPHESASCEKAKLMTLEKRQTIVKEKRACFKCLKMNHSYKKCRSKLKCAWCARGHPLLLCRDVNKSEAADKTSADTLENLTTLCNNASCDPEVYLQTLRVKLIGPRGEVIVRALIDSGSHRSYVLKSVAESLQLTPVRQQTMVHLLFGGEKSEPRRHCEYRLRLGNLDGKYECYLMAFDENVICQKIPAVSTGNWMQDLKKLGVSLTDVIVSNEPIALLIGADVAGKLYTSKMYQVPNGPTALQTKLGWTLLGKTGVKKPPREDAVLNVLSTINHESRISDLWDLDVLGITDPATTISKELHLEMIKQRFEQTVKLNEEGRYEVNLPWKENHPPLTDNRPAAEKRLRVLTHKLHDEGLFEKYDQVFNEWLQQGIIEKVENMQVKENGYFLPHRHVVKPNSTTKIRPVFDASASGKDGPSLNQCLETGPNLIELIPSILLRFMKNKIGVAADITKAFLQISIEPKDRDVLRFLWWDHGDTEKIIVYRHRRVVFGINSSPFLLGATIEHHLVKEMGSSNSQADYELLEKLQLSFYVDNCVTSVATKKEAADFEKKSTAIMRKAGFELRGWEYTERNVESAVTSVLGICWDKSKDSMSLSMNFLEPLNKPVTKRIILADAHKVFDPLGWACPTLLLPKLMLQNLSSLDLEWDTEVPAIEALEFKQWRDQLSNLKNMWIPRWIFESKAARICEVRCTPHMPNTKKYT